MLSQPQRRLILPQGGHRNRNIKRCSRSAHSELTGVRRKRATGAVALATRGPEHVAKHSRARPSTGRGEILDEARCRVLIGVAEVVAIDRKSTRLNSSHLV